MMNRTLVSASKLCIHVHVDMGAWGKYLNQDSTFMLYGRGVHK